MTSQWFLVSSESLKQSEVNGIDWLCNALPVGGWATAPGKVHCTRKSCSLSGHRLVSSIKDASSGLGHFENAETWWRAEQNFVNNIPKSNKPLEAKMYLVVHRQYNILKFPLKRCNCNLFVKIKCNWNVTVSYLIKFKQSCLWYNYQTSVIYYVLIFINGLLFLSFPSSPEWASPYSTLHIYPLLRAWSFTFSGIKWLHNCPRYETTTALGAWTCRISIESQTFYRNSDGNEHSSHCLDTHTTKSAVLWIDVERTCFWHWHWESRAIIMQDI